MRLDQTRGQKKKEKKKMLVEDYTLILTFTVIMFYIIILDYNIFWIYDPNEVLGNINDR